MLLPAPATFVLAAFGILVGYNVSQPSLYRSLCVLVVCFGYWFGVASSRVGLRLSVFGVYMCYALHYYGELTFC